MALVVHDHKSGEVDHVDLPHRLHPEFSEVDHLDGPDMVLGQDRGGTPDGTKIEATVVLAGLGHHRAAIALGEHDE